MPSTATAIHQKFVEAKSLSTEPILRPVPMDWRELKQFSVYDWFNLLIAPGFGDTEMVAIMSSPFDGMEPCEISVYDRQDLLEQVIEEIALSLAPLIAHDRLIDHIHSVLKLSDTTLQVCFYDTEVVYEGFLQVWSSERSLPKISDWYDEYKYLTLLDMESPFGDTKTLDEYRELGIAFEHRILSKKNRNVERGFILSAADVLRHRDPKPGSFVPIVPHEQPDDEPGVFALAEHHASILDPEWSELSPAQKQMIEEMEEIRPSRVGQVQFGIHVTNRFPNETGINPLVDHDGRSFSPGDDLDTPSSEHFPPPMREHPPIRKSMSVPDLGQYTGNVWLEPDIDQPGGPGKDKTQEIIISEFLRKRGEAQKPRSRIKGFLKKKGN